MTEIEQRMTKDLEEYGATIGITEPKAIVEKLVSMLPDAYVQDCIAAQSTQIAMAWNALQMLSNNKHVYGGDPAKIDAFVADAKSRITTSPTGAEDYRIALIVAREMREHADILEALE